MTSKPSLEYQRLQRLAGALGQLDRAGETWRALEQIIGEHNADARTHAHDPAQQEARRPFWNGADYALSELWKELQELQSGAWKQWPNVAAMSGTDRGSEE
jgi:hypothetical protein